MENEIKQIRVAVYVDGGNFYFKMKDDEMSVPNILEFDFRSFIEWLSRGRIIISGRYYVGVVRAEDGNEKGQKLRKAQQKLFAHLESPE